MTGVSDPRVRGGGGRRPAACRSWRWPCCAARRSAAAASRPASASATAPGAWASSASCPRSCATSSSRSSARSSRRWRSSPAAGPRRPRRSMPPASPPTCTSPRPGCSTGSSRTAPGGSCSRASSAAATSGPARSFPLWDAQIERLLPSAADGVQRALRRRHPRRALRRDGVGRCRPLVARGAHRRAHGHRLPVHRGGRAGGAIGPHSRPRPCVRHDRAAGVRAGHATRCAEPAYVGTFQQARRDLRGRRAPTATAMWAELETLNLGRLRIAARASPDGDARRRRRRRAAARRHVHDRPGRGPARRGHLGRRPAPRGDRGRHRLLAATPARAEAPPAPTRPGARPARRGHRRHGLVMPGATDLEEFWQHRRRRQPVTEVPAERWDAEQLLRPRLVHAPPTGRRLTRVEVGRVPDPRRVRPPRLRHPARFAGRDRAGAAPALEVAARALADAGYARPRLRPRTHGR